ncbi:MAG: hypothetical protein M1281_20260 [Chloroflexi bacterium]|nr:hypothetical protein [Chloroflexota bacterium]
MLRLIGRLEENSASIDADCHDITILNLISTGICSQNLRVDREQLCQASLQGMRQMVADVVADLRANGKPVLETYGN